MDKPNLWVVIAEGCPACMILGAFLQEKEIRNLCNITFLDIFLLTRNLPTIFNLLDLDFKVNLDKNVITPQMYVSKKNKPLVKIDNDIIINALNAGNTKIKDELKSYLIS